MRGFIYLASVFVLFLLNSCNKQEDVAIPSGTYPFMSETYPLEDSSKAVMEGIYSVEGRQDVFGEEVVLKWTRTSLLVACKNGRYFVLSAGRLDSLVILQGYWRYALSDETGTSTFFVSKNEGGTSIVTGQKTDNLILRGAFGYDSGIPGEALIFRYIRPFSDKVLNQEFHILAHRSGGRTSDRLPVSENSIEMIDYTEKFGSTGIEVDVRISSDGVPFLYHDDDINIRLTQEGPLLGDVTKYSWNTLSTYVKLIHGERIPSLQHALDFVLDSTNLNFVYLDIKGGGPVVDKVIPIQSAILNRAEAMGKDLIVVIGIPDAELQSYFISIPGHDTIPSLCELTVEDVRNANSMVWAPRWTMGTQNDLVQQMHAEGRLAVSWTVDPINYIKQFIEEGNFDGLLTNYPSIVAYYHYIQ